MAMSKKLKRRKRKRKWNKTIGVLLCVVAMAAIIILSALYQKNAQPSRVPASEYFEAQVNVVLAEPKDEYNNTILIRILSFNLTPIGGDAHSVTVRPPGYIPEKEWKHYPELSQGELELIEIEYHDPHFYPLEKRDNVYSFPITITCKEASGEVILNFTDFYPYPPFK